ncbi:MAG TPA: HAD family hydrolase [Leptolyngbyaceae cyanobacterium]
MLVNEDYKLEKMRYLALATDYDGTIATHGQVDAKTLDALSRFRDTNRKLILVTGRHLEELLQIFPQIHLFDRAVLENGALLYRPATGEEKVLGERPPEAFIKALQQRGVHPLAVGRVIVATWRPHENTVEEVIRELGLNWQIIFNKDAVMVLPCGLNKTTGLMAALEELQLSPEKTIGVGDAENDRDFIKICAYSVAVANALPIVKQEVDWVTKGDRGAGVTELIDRIIDSDCS